MRLDQALASRGLCQSRSQAESYIRLGFVQVNGDVASKASRNVSHSDDIRIASDQFVSRAGLKLASIAADFGLDFRGKNVLDVGSSTGGFTDYALQHGAGKVVAVDVGTNQLHPSLRTNDRIELHEQTNILEVGIVNKQATKFRVGIQSPDIVVIDVSFVSLRTILPHIASLCMPTTLVVAMCKPQFEAGGIVKHKGVIKNDQMRRGILKDFESWLKAYFNVLDKADSAVSGTKGNRERFYLLKTLA